MVAALAGLWACGSIDVALPGPDGGGAGRSGGGGASGAGGHEIGPVVCGTMVCPLTYQCCTGCDGSRSCAAACTGLACAAGGAPGAGGSGSGGSTASGGATGAGGRSGVGGASGAGGKAGAGGALGAGGRAGSGGESGVGGKTGAGGAGGVSACQAVAALDRSCTADADCVAVRHVANCCGTARIIGLNKAAEAAFAQLEPACDASYPACGCATGATTTDDGSVIKPAETAGVFCQAGTCTTFVPECAHPCAAGTACFTCVAHNATYGACTTPCTASTDCTDPSLPLCQMAVSGNLPGKYCTAAAVACDTK
jgi:hypothetical protein